jgi:hypothetical protein
MGWYGWGHDMGWAGWLGMWLMMLVFWGLLVAGGFWLVRTIKSDRAGASPPSSARQILDERLARGELAETGSLGEASDNCAANTGDGIAPGGASWTTVTLQPGRYELVCNVPGHYAAGMYAELDVTS